MTTTGAAVLRVASRQYPRLMTKSTIFAASTRNSRQHPWIQPGSIRQFRTQGSSPTTIAAPGIIGEPQNSIPDISPPSSSAQSMSPASATAHLSFPALLKTYFVTACTSSPPIIAASIKVLSAIAYSKSLLLSPDRNPVLHWLLKYTVYSQFCAGETAAEVQATIRHLQSTGIKGIILCYAREVELRGDKPATAKVELDTQAEAEINAWAEGIMQTLRVVPDDNFISIKFSGAGALILHCLQNSLPPPSLFTQHLQQICKLAHSKHVRICIDAEQSTFQPGIDSWTLDLQKQFNTTRSDPTNTSTETNGEPWACVYNTYQCYLRNTPAVLAKHLQQASRESFTPGIKLVRGAYLASEPRQLFWSTKEETDRCYDTLAKAVMTRSWDSINDMTEASNTPKSTSSSPSTKEPIFPSSSLVLATHNLESCRTALALRQQQATLNTPRIEMVYAQLQGMADHVTGELVQAAKQAEAQTGVLLEASDEVKAGAGAPAQTSKTSIDVPQVCKYLTWGTVGECAKYLVRRAEENRDAVARTAEARRALGKEIGRRVWGLVA